MFALAPHPRLGIECPTCPEHGIPLEIIEMCRHLLAERGPCVGPASYECPALYFASLVGSQAAGDGTLDVELARWEDDGGAVLDPTT